MGSIKTYIAIKKLQSVMTLNLTYRWRTTRTMKSRHTRATRAPSARRDRARCHHLDKIIQKCQSHFRSSKRKTPTTITSQIQTEGYSKSRTRDGEGSVGTIVLLRGWTSHTDRCDLVSLRAMIQY